MIIEEELDVRYSPGIQVYESGKYRVLYHRGREQEYTIWNDGRVEKFLSAVEMRYHVLGSGVFSNLIG